MYLLMSLFREVINRAQHRQLEELLPLSQSLLSGENSGAVVVTFTAGTAVGAGSAILSVTDANDKINIAHCRHEYHGGPCCA